MIPLVRPMIGALLGDDAEGGARRRAVRRLQRRGRAEILGTAAVAPTASAGNPACGTHRPAPPRPGERRVSGYVASRARSPLCRRRTARHSSPGASENASPLSASTTYHAPSSISSWSWPGDQPAYPAKIRSAPSPVPSTSGGASRSIKPTRAYSRRQPTGSSSPRTCARPSALSSATGPPWNTTSGELVRLTKGGHRDADLGEPVHHQPEYVDSSTATARSREMPLRRAPFSTLSRTACTSRPTCRTPRRRTRSRCSRSISSPRTQASR